ncbi:MAG: hydrolase [Catenulispora sp.]|nr:hydrolase [Catenulispora sp.]
MHELITTPAGDARITRFPAPARKRRAVLALGHGAGGGIAAPDLQALAAALPADGIEVVLIEQPWVVAGKKIAPAPKTLDAGWLPAAEAVRKSSARKTPFLVGGRSAGARVACRTGAATGATGIVALAFPLHPPGKPEKSRAEELTDTGLPTLVVQGATDPFGTPAEFPKLPPTHRLIGLPAGDHGFKTKKSEEPVLEGLVAAVSEWIGGLVR